MKVLIAATLFGASLAGLALAQPPSAETTATQQAEPYGLAAPTDGASIPDARSVASDQAVGQARRAYRAQCSRTEKAAFCECVTAGVAQALPPNEVQLAARTVRERLSAQGDAAPAPSAEGPAPDADPLIRIEHVEGFYANACAQFR